MFGDSSVNIAPYTVLEKEDNLELRHYERLLLVSTTMPEGMEDQKAPFYKLFDYISGKNQDAQDIPMTAPVFMNQADQKTETMSFVLPASLTMEEAPQPQDSAVKLEHITDYIVATITFSGSLSQNNINHHQVLLEQWIKRKGYKETGQAKGGWIQSTLYHSNSEAKRGFDSRSEAMNVPTFRLGVRPPLSA